MFLCCGIRSNSLFGLTAKKVLDIFFDRLSGSENDSFTTSGRNSAVECQLPKLDVVGSNPIARYAFIWKFTILDFRHVFTYDTLLMDIGLTFQRNRF